MLHISLTYTRRHACMYVDLPPCAAAGLQLTEALQEQLRYCSDILRPWSHWDMKDLLPGFFAAKPLTPDDFDVVLAKYRERRLAAKQQRERERERECQQQWEQERVNGELHDRRKQQQYREDVQDR